MNPVRFSASNLSKIVIALTLIAAAYLLRQALLVYCGFALSPYLTYIPPAIISTLLLGLWTGLIATAASSLAAFIMAVPPEGKLQVKNTYDTLAVLLATALCAVLCVMLDQLRRKQRKLDQIESEKALNETRVKLQAALESSAEAMVICDTDGNFIEFNQALATFIRAKDKSDLLRRQSDYSALLDVFYPDGTPVPPEMWVVPRALRGEQGTGVEYWQKRKDTGETWAGSFNFAPIRGNNGQITGCVISALDITERKRAEEALRNNEKLYRTAFQTCADSLVISRIRDRQYIDVNHRFTECFGFTREEAVGRTGAELGIWADMADREKLVAAISAGTEYRDIEIEFRRRDGAQIWGLVSAARLMIDGEECILTSMRDITREKLTEQARNSIEVRYRAAFETSPNVLVITRLEDGVYMEVNPAFTTITGWEREEILGKSAKDINIWVDYSYRSVMVDIIRTGQPFHDVEIQLRRKNGSILWVNVDATVIDVGGIECAMIQARDISNEKKAEEEIRMLAFYDQLTGLANRRLLAEQFRKSIALSTRTHHKRALLFIDLDNFKNLNETRGHHAGDLLLREVAYRLSECISPSDTLARLGGDEFAVILEELHANPEIAATQAMAGSEKILHRISQPYLLESAEVRSSCSIGITVCGEEQDDFNYVLQQADIAMYQAKSAGRNTMRFFAPELQAAVTARALLEDEIRQGLEKHQFVLQYQPQFEQNTLIGAEALLRWQHPRHGLLSPGSVIALAEETRLILPLGAWVLETACKQIAAWSAQYPEKEIRISVNISALELSRSDFVASVLSVVQRTGIPPGSLKLELTESMLVDNAEDAIAKMTALKMHGIRFALDDFGTGYSSLSYLKRLPLSQIKIDRSFVRDILTDPNSNAIVQTIIGLGRSLDMRVVAEGVETEAQLAVLKTLGCRAYQGFLFGHPMPPEEFERQVLNLPRNRALQMM